VWPILHQTRRREARLLHFTPASVLCSLG
jgi:hypothetical protein